MCTSQIGDFDDMDLTIWQCGLSNLVTWQCGLGDLVKWTWTYACRSQLGKLVKQMVPYIGWLVSSFVCAKYATVRDTEHGVHLVELVQSVSLLHCKSWNNSNKWKGEKNTKSQF
jgi:hypothetical protein